MLGDFLCCCCSTTPPVKEVKYMRQNIGCNLVEWRPIDTGNCHVTYTIQYETQAGIIGFITDIDDATRAWCTDLYSDATSIKMWAVYSGSVGTKSVSIPLTDNLCFSADSPGKHFFIYTLVFTEIRTFI